MRVLKRLCVCCLMVAGMLAGAGVRPANGQEPDHALSTKQLHRDLQKAAEVRTANEAAVREMFANEKSREALKSAGIEYQKVDQAISQISDEDLARMAERSRDVQKDFAAGKYSDRDLLILLLVAVALVLIIVAVR